MQAIDEFGKNVEINARIFPLISTRPVADASNLVQFDVTDRVEISGKFFVHVKNKAILSETSAATSDSMQIEGLYICTVYVHATQCLGTFIVPSKRDNRCLAHWVYLSCIHFWFRATFNKEFRIAS
jgi:hypothetical protein